MSVTAPLPLYSGPDSYRNASSIGDLMLKCIMAFSLLTASTIAEATSPQQPIAEGPFESISKATEAARECGFRELRVVVRPTKSQLFIDGEMPSMEVQQCFSALMTPRGKKMKFSPRWWNDDFTRDHP
ncbi:hypothetical protein [Novosphingobium sp. Leaf2]|uniref:hypothetical protein n=1 Tax=Novosphingobium sp. Leaf2 TaxID=1735670 RepID=UPI00138EF3CE|nr:hypothetical protein [Novosphingobium sp. Leaf2]